MSSSSSSTPNYGNNNNAVDVSNSIITNSLSVITNMFATYALTIAMKYTDQIELLLFLSIMTIVFVVYVIEWLRSMMLADDKIDQTEAVSLKFAEIIHLALIFIIVQLIIAIGVNILEWSTFTWYDVITVCFPIFGLMFVAVQKYMTMT